jgi:hypothetical protein
MSHDDRPIRIVLDTSAILAYARGSIHVGEPLAEVTDENAVAVLPSLCLAEARWMVGDPGRLKILLEHPATAVMAPSSDWRTLAELQKVVGTLDATSAVALAMDHRGVVLTARSGLYAGLEDGGPIIGI